MESIHTGRRCPAPQPKRAHSVGHDGGQRVGRWWGQMAHGTHPQWHFCELAVRNEFADRRAATTIRRQRDRCVPSTWPSVRSEYRGGLRQPRVYQKGGARGSLCGSVVNSRWSQAGCERPNNGSLTALPLHAYPALLEVDGLQLPIQDVIRPLCFHCAGRSHTQVVGVGRRPWRLPSPYAIRKAAAPRLCAQGSRGRKTG